MSRNRTAFTIIELLTVIAILSLLAALFLPAVQRAREAARRAQCQNHLKQLGLAIQNYQGAHAVYPPGSLLGGWSWRTMLLPYLDQAGRYATVNFENNIERPAGQYSCASELQRLEGLVPDWADWGPLLRCPSNPFVLRRHSTYVGVSGYHMPHSIRIMHPEIR